MAVVAVGTNKRVYRGGWQRIHWKALISLFLFGSVLCAIFLVAKGPFLLKDLNEPIENEKSLHILTTATTPKTTVRTITTATVTATVTTTATATETEAAEAAAAAAARVLDNKRKKISIAASDAKRNKKLETKQTKALRDEIQKSVPTDMTVDIIVNCCSESPTWMEVFAHYLPIRNLHIYNKCELSHGELLNATETKTEDDQIELRPTSSDHWLHSISGRAYVINLPNVGREGHSWLTHILRETVEDLADWSLFLQCGYECALQDIQLGLLNVTQGQCDFMDLHQYRFLERFKQDNRRQDRYFLWSYGKTLEGKQEYSWLLENICSFHNMYGYDESVECDYAVITLRGEFFVHKQLILDNRNNPKLWKLYKRVSSENDPPEGHFLERGWVEVLGARKRMCDILPMKLRLPPFKRRHMKAD